MFVGEKFKLSKWEVDLSETGISKRLHSKVKAPFFKLSFSKGGLVK
jgi:hypothetical protein